MPVMVYAQKFIHPDDAHILNPEHQRQVLETAEPSQSKQLEHRVIRADGSEGYFLVKFREIKDEQGWTIRTVGINQDITEQKQAEAERERLLAEVQGAYRQYIQREWEEFLSGQQQSSLHVEHQQKAAPTIFNDELAKAQAEVAHEGKAKVIAPPNVAPTQPVIVAPIALRGQVIGTLSLQDIDPDRYWTDEEKALVETVSEQLALTVENLRLFDDTQKRALREQMTRQIADKMRAAPDIDSIVQTGLNELAKALNVSRAYVKLTTKPEDKDR
jgi:GAF domain-containing protein